MSYRTKEFFYSHDYPNDTKLIVADEPWNNRIKLTLKFTSEDPDYGTDTLEYPDKMNKLKFEEWKTLATELLMDLTFFLDKTENGNKRNDDLIKTISNARILGDYSNTTLYAWEGILNKLLHEEEKEMANHYGVGTKVQVVYDMNNLINIGTGNTFSVAKGQVGTIIKASVREDTDSAMCLVHFENIPDKYADGSVAGWVPEVDLNIYTEKKWYMSVKEASAMIVKAWREDASMVFSFCESDRYEAMGDPTKHKDDCEWFGAKMIASPFDADSCEFNAMVGYWGGGSLVLAHVEYWEADDAMCEDVLRNAICRSTGWDADNYIYIEEEEK